MLVNRLLRILWRAKSHSAKDQKYAAVENALPLRPNRGVLGRSSEGFGKLRGWRDEDHNTGNDGILRRAEHRCVPRRAEIPCRIGRQQPPKLSDSSLQPIEQ